ncbi:MAG: hypothetical protein FJ091_12455 [Deltaproteobacteria bacterium]|nr:hypothetical protein [Deltaproteobacteria bacterium]
MSLASALDAAARALPEYEDLIRPANGDSLRVLAGASPAAAQKLLGWLLSEHPDDADELVNEWLSEEAGRSALFGLKEGALSKPGKKALRRWLHRLRSAGDAVPKPAAPAPTVAKLAKVEEDVTGAYLSAIDASGIRMAYFLEPHPQGGTRVFEVVFDDAHGIQGFRVLQATRGNARRFLDDLARENKGSADALAADSVRAVVARAAARQPKDRPLPRGFAEWRSRVAAAPEGAQLPGEIAEAALGASVVAEDLRAAVKLVEESKLGPWPPLREKVLPIIERVRADLASPLALSGATKAERLDGRIEEALADLYDADGSATAAHRCRESAFSFWRAGDEPAARACLAAAREFASAKPADNPVARALAERLLRPAFEALAREAEASAKPA